MMPKELTKKDLVGIMEQMPEKMSPRDASIILCAIVSNYGMEESFPLIVTASAVALGLAEVVDKSQIN